MDVPFWSENCELPVSLNTYKKMADEEKVFSRSSSQPDKRLVGAMKSH